MTSALEYYGTLDRFTLGEFLRDELAFHGIHFDDFEQLVYYLVKTLDTTVEYVEDVLDNKIPLGMAHADILYKICNVSYAQARSFYDREMAKKDIYDDKRLSKQCNETIARMLTVYKLCRYGNKTPEQACKMVKNFSRNPKHTYERSKIIALFMKNHPDFTGTRVEIEQLIRDGYCNNDIHSITSLTYKHIIYLRNGVYDDDPELAVKHAREKLANGEYITKSLRNKLDEH